MAKKKGKEYSDSQILGIALIGCALVYGVYLAGVISYDYVPHTMLGIIIYNLIWIISRRIKNEKG